jgi:hypothetical protein
VQQVRELGSDRIALGVGEERPGLDVGDPRVFIDRRTVERVMALTWSAGRFFVAELGNTWQRRSGHVRVVLLEGGQDELEVRGRDLGVEASSRSFVPMSSTTAAGFTAARPPAAGSGRRVGVSADPAVCDLDPGKRRAQTSTPAWVIESPRKTTACWSWSTCWPAERRSRHRFWNQSYLRMGPAPGRPASVAGIANRSGRRRRS